MSTQIRGLAPAMRVMSRSDPPAAGQRLVPLDPGSAGLVEQHVRERVRQVARHRDEPVVGGGIDRDGARAERGDEPVHGAVALGLGRRRAGSGTTSRPSNSSAVARSGPRVSAPQIGWPPTKRASAPRRRRPPPFVEPTSVTAQPAGGVLEHRAHERRQLGDRGGDEREVRALERLLERARRLDRAPLGRDARGVRVGVPAA